MSVDHITTDRLRSRDEKVFIVHIILYTDNFLHFVKDMWQDFMC